MNLILASASPRRRELLDSIGLSFGVVISNIEEVPLAGESVEAYVIRLAREKGADVSRRHPEAWTIAADTVVHIDGEILEKPRDDAHAVRMLRQIAGRQHTVYSGVSLHHRASGFSRTRSISTAVTISPLTDEQIDWYVTTGEPRDKAGAYAVQGIGAMFIERVDGNYTNVVGLPLSLLLTMFQEAGIDLIRHAAPSGRH